MKLITLTIGALNRDVRRQIVGYFRSKRRPGPLRGLSHSWVAVSCLFARVSLAGMIFLLLRAIDCAGAYEN